MKMQMIIIIIKEGVPMQRTGKYRALILAYLKSTDSHPSAEQVYAALKPACPKISLATVYRNLRSLQESGQIDTLGNICGQERFDGCRDPHAHAVCEKCGKVMDLPSFALPAEWLSDASEKTGFSFSSPNLQVVGVCADCRRKEN